MKKWLWIPAVLLLAFAGDRLFALALRQFADDADFRYSRMYTGRGEAEIVLLGNSRGLNFYQPILEELTGRSTLNLSYNAMPVDLGAALLADYLDAYGAPEDLVIDVTLLDRDNVELIREFRVYAQYSQRIDSLLRLHDPAIHGGTVLSHLTRYGGEVAQRMFYYNFKSDFDWMVDRQISPSLAAAATGLEPYRNAYTLTRVRALAEVTKQFADAGTRVHYVINPYYPAFAKTIGNLDSLSNDVRTATGVPVLDYSRSITGDENFGDYQHLNKEGVAIYMERLVRDLKL